ncbi:hypothetical protein Tco_1107639 [Tanacetum coccineum]
MTSRPRTRIPSRPTQASQEILTPTAFQTDDLDAFDYDYDNVPSAKAVVMANLSSYDSDVLSECSEQPSFDNDTEVDITSDSNIISYEQYLQETENLVVQSTSSYVQQDELLISVIEEMSSQVLKCNKVQQENLIVNETLTAELERYKEHVIVDRNAKVADFEKQIHLLKLQLNATVESHKTLSTIVECLKKASKQKEDKYLDEMFGHSLYKELKEMKAVFNQMETEVAKYSEDKKYLEIEKKELNLDNDSLLEHIICQDVMNIVMHDNDHYDNVLLVNNNSLEHDNSALELLKHENDRLMEPLISQDLVHTAVNSLATINDYKTLQQSFVDEYNETLVLKAKLAKKHDMIEKAVYNELSKQCSRLKNRCISLEIKLQQSKETQLKAKNVSIEKLKEHVANIKGKNVVENPDLYLQYKMSGKEPAPQMAPVESSQMISTVKLLMLKKDENGVETKVPPKTAQAILARQKERKSKSIILLAIPDEYQLRFHTIKDAKSLWAAIKSSQLEVHGAAVSNEDANQKLLRALPSSWNNVALIMRNKAGIDDLDIDDLCNNIKVFEADIKGSSGSSLNSHNVAFLSAKDTNSINEVNTANGVSTASGHNSQGQASSSSYTDDLMECRATRNQGNKNGDAWYRSRDNTRRIVPVETSDALVVQDNALIMQDGLGYDWSYIAQDKLTEFALMAYTLGSKTKANLDIVAYQLGLESVEAQLVVHQKNEVLLKTTITLIVNKSKDKNLSGYVRPLDENDSSGSELFKSVFDSRSSDGDDNQTNDRFKKDNGYHAVPPPLTGNYMPLLADYLIEGNGLFGFQDLCLRQELLEYMCVYENDASKSSKPSWGKMYKKDNGYHDVPPPLTGNYMPPLADLSFVGLDDSVYRPTVNKTSASVSQVETNITPPSNYSVEMPRVESVRPSGVIIED